MGTRAPVVSASCALPRATVPGGLRELCMHAKGGSVIGGGGSFAASAEPELLNESPHCFAKRPLIDSCQSCPILCDVLLYPRIPSPNLSLQHDMEMAVITAKLKLFKAG